MKGPQRMRQSWGVGRRAGYLAGAENAAATLLESEGLLALILVSLELTSWTGGPGTGLEADWKAPCHLEATPQT